MSPLKIAKNISAASLLEIAKANLEKVPEHEDSSDKTRFLECLKGVKSNELKIEQKELSLKCSTEATFDIYIHSEKSISLNYRL